jgi:hypothetical protein
MMAQIFRILQSFIPLLTCSAANLLRGMPADIPNGWNGMGHVS